MSKYLEEEQFNQYFKKAIEKKEIGDLIQKLHLLIQKLESLI
jgi:hypothetical protein